MPDRPLRLGDVTEDYCPRCRLLLNHDISAITNGAVAQVTCRTCYNTHEYRHAQVPKKRPKKDDKAKLIEQVLSGMPQVPQPPPPPPPAANPAVRKRRDLWAELDRIQKKK